jgi:hypothetical protein
MQKSIEGTKKIFARAPKSTSLKNKKYILLTTQGVLKKLLIKINKRSIGIVRT